MSLGPLRHHDPLLCGPLLHSLNAQFPQLRKKNAEASFLRVAWVVRSPQSSPRPTARTGHANCEAQRWQPPGQPLFAEILEAIFEGRDSILRASRTAGNRLLQ